MNLESLRERCISDYGRSSGRKLFSVMKKIADEGFCISTGWTHNELSVSRGCAYRGTIFKITKGYHEIIMPNGTIKSIEDIDYEEIIDYIPTLKFSTGYRHCDSYKKYSPDPKEWLLKLGIHHK
jgi:hypothetical protein